MSHTPRPRDPPHARREWPVPALDATLLSQIEATVRSRVRLTIPSSVIDPQQPAVPLTMPEYRRILLHRSTPADAIDRAWRHLCEPARTTKGDEREGWNLYALGAAYPRLRALAAKLRGDRTWEQWQYIHHLLAVEFLDAVHRLNLEHGNVFSRLAGTAYDHASGRKRHPPPVPVDIDDLRQDQHPVSPYGNPEHDAETSRETVRAVLDRLVTKANSNGAARITPTQADLIRRTYLDGEKLRTVAADLGLSEPSASKHRQRAAHTIARLLRRPDLITAAGQSGGM